MKTLTKYFKDESNLNKAQLALKLDISTSALEKYMYGLRLPRLDIALNIEQITGISCRDQLEFYNSMQKESNIALIDML